MELPMDELRRHWGDIYDLSCIGSLLNWDQSTYMPPGGAAARSRQATIVARLAHERLIDPALQLVLDRAEAQTAQLPYDSPDASFVRVARRDVEKATKLPTEFVERANAHVTALYERWVEARASDNFALVADGLERSLELARTYGGYFPHDHIADPLVDDAEPGMTVASVRAIFAELRAALVPLVAAVCAAPPADNAMLTRHYPKQQQLDFGSMIAGQLGYDFQRGRVDLTHHPFMTRFSLGDIRITTRVDEHDLGNCLFSMIHETGHALYEQGIDQQFEGTALAGGTSAGVHESQSRLWENQVGRSRAYWQHTYPQLQAAFPGRLDDVDAEQFYRAINRVDRSLIRTEADELTYNLHVIIRFDLELDLIEGRLAARDLPEAWRERYRSDLGVTPEDDADGCLQDLHWYSGLVAGSFHGYTLGNLMSAQFYATALAQHPEIGEQIGRGEFGTLLSWLRQNIYRYGRGLTAPELLQRVCGERISVAPYIGYLRRKYSDLYGLAL